MSTHDANRRFAHNFFSASDDAEGQDQADEHEQRPDDGLDAQRRFAADLFAGDNEDAGLLAGLTAGKTVGRTAAPKAPDVDRGEFRFS